MAAKAGKGTLAIEVEPVEFKNLLRLLGSLPAESQQEVRDRALPLSQRFAGQLLMFAQASRTPQAVKVAESLMPKRDRLIRVDVGGTKKVGRKYGGEKRKGGKVVKQNQAPAGALLWGSEYGSHRGVDRRGRAYSDRFKAPYNKSGYWINPAMDYYLPIIAREYAQMVQDVVKKAGMD
jgi:hypothetical protein